MRKKGKEYDESIENYHNLNEKILELRDNVLEEFDMLELVEDSIKDVFDCNLNCATCTVNDRAKCMQHFKKANILWLRKIAQDEWMIKDIVIKMDEMREALSEMMKETKKYYKSKKASEKTIEEHKGQVKKKVEKTHGYNFYS